MPTQSFEDAAFAVAQALSPRQRLRRDEVPYDDIRKVLADFCERSGLTAERIRTYPRRPSIKRPSPSAEDECTVSSSSDSRLSADEASQASSCLSLTLQSLPGPALINPTTVSPPSCSSPAPQTSLESRIRSLQDQRKARREALDTKDFFSLECEDVSGLGAVFDEQWKQILEEDMLPAVRYRIVLNSLVHYFDGLPDKDTIPGGVDTVMCDFLRRHVLKSNAEIVQKYDEMMPLTMTNEGLSCRALSSLRLRETETGILLQLYVLSKHPAPVSTTHILEKLRYIYIEEAASYMRNFLDDVICDEFADVIPASLCKLYQELDLAMPIDLESHKWEAEPEEQEEVEEEERESRVERRSSLVLVKREMRTPSPTPTSSFPPPPPPTFSFPTTPPPPVLPSHQAVTRTASHSRSKSEITARLAALFTEDGDETLEPKPAAASTASKRKRPSKAKKEKEPRQNERRNSNASELARTLQPLSAEPPQIQKKRRRTFVPETPDDKEMSRPQTKKARRSLDAVDEKETAKATPKKADVKDPKAVVLQTPIEKLQRMRRSTRGSRIAALVRKTLTPAAAVPASAPSAVGTAATLRRSARHSVSAAVRAAHRDSPVTTKAAFLAIPDTRRGSRGSGGSGRTTKRAPVSSPLRGSPNKAGGKRRPFASTAGTILSPASTPEKKTKAAHSLTSMSLEADAAKRYKERMREVVRGSRHEDPSEVFYGRLSNRVGLYDEEEEREAEKKPTKTTAGATEVSYSRTGRILYNPSCVFVAHTLLNVHNPEPLLPTRPSNMHPEFKLARLVRAASKGDRRKINKLRVRFQKKESEAATPLSLPISSMTPSSSNSSLPSEASAV